MSATKLPHESTVDAGRRAVSMTPMYPGVSGHGVGEEGGSKCGLEE